jgi:hypothetical protein
LVAGAWFAEAPKVNPGPLEEPPSFTGGAGAEPKLPMGAGAGSGAAVFPN